MAICWLGSELKDGARMLGCLGSWDFWTDRAAVLALLSQACGGAAWLAFEGCSARARANLAFPTRLEC
jgi:hypothetical protein